MPRSKKIPQFAICLSNDNYPASLEVGRIYEIVPDPKAAAHKMIRVIDESGDDYVYSDDRFMAVGQALS